MAKEKSDIVYFEMGKKSSVLRNRLSLMLVLFALGLLLVTAVQFLVRFCLRDTQIGEKDIQLVHDDETGAQLGSALVFQHRSGNVWLKNSKTKAALYGRLGQSFRHETALNREVKKHTLAVEWDNSVSLNMSIDGDRCFQINWNSNQNDEPKYFLDCFDLGGEHWYGGSELYRQEWPLEKANVKMMPYLPSDTILGIGRGQKVYGTVLERFWFTSEGMAILVNESVPLHVSINASGDKQLCLKADPANYPSTIPLHLSYKLCVGDNVKEIQQFVMKEFFQYPAGIPDERMMKQPIWSTWAQFGKGVNQTKVLSYAAKIKQSGFSYSQVEIDDKYSTYYGDFDFDPGKFPDPKAMIESLHSDSFRVTVWVYPFANTNSVAFQKGMKYWVKGPDNVPALLSWWNGIATTIDTTNIEAAEWFRNRLSAFMDTYQIDGFKFDAGEVTYLPACYRLHSLMDNNPDYYSIKYAEIAASLGTVIEVRVGHRTQQLPLFVRMLDRSSSWDENNGLRSVIPATLTFGVLGYPFVLPDMIGGNGYQLWSESGFNRPDGELFIRWVQASVFLPSMQFSIAPWDMDNETLLITKKTMQLREQFADYIVSCAKQATQTGEPIVRPLWWVAPNDTVAQEIYTEFMLGDSYLVAPVLTPMDENQGKHSVYLPKGVWEEQFATKKVISVGSVGLWLEYSVTLEDLPFFVLLAD